MCGILFHLSYEKWSPPTEFLDIISARGPDSLRTETVRHILPHLQEPDNCCYLSFTSTVLFLRDHLSVQPKVCPNSGSILCWNGEAWKINGSELLPHQNDTEEIFKLLVDASRSDEPSSSIINVLNSISGPYAFVYFDKLGSKVWFGRDCIGRRSLLLYQKNGQLTIASVSDGDKEKQWEEVEADGIYYLDLKKPKREGNTQKNRIPYVYANTETSVESSLTMVYPYRSLNKSIPSSPPDPTALSPYASQLRTLLAESIRLRVQNVPLAPNFQHSSETEHVSRVGILFSGGLDCTVLARLAHYVLPPFDLIDLLNVGFENQRVVNARLDNATNRRKRKSKAKPSGNQDSCTLTLESGVGAAPLVNPYELCPDRVTARSSLAELRNTCPGRTFNFVSINISYSTFLAHRRKVISLIRPQNTEMDLSIAIAFYFAARGVGSLETESGEKIPYSTPSRILLSGLGADELFAGYGRHSTSFKKGGYKALLDELNLDFTRLGKRNLGRDDRVISNWGKEARYPFLDEDLVNWAMEVGIERKCQFDQRGDNLSLCGSANTHDEKSVEIEGGKKVLRLLAKELGLENVAREKKRAVQFGARTAKMDVSIVTSSTGSVSKIKGTRVVDE